MAAPHNVELEAAKFLQKLIHESTDEPARLATKLYVILQHMKASGKENSMPYQVISRAMETVINQHGLDIEALTSSRVPSSTEPQGESSTTHAAGGSQAPPISDPKSGMTNNETTKTDGFGSCRPPTAPNSLGPDLFQGSGSQRSGRSFDHESPSSIDTKSTNSHSQDRRETASWEQQGAQKNSKRASVKRKKSDSSAMEPLDDSIQQPDSHNTVPEVKKERLTSKVEMPGSFPGLSESWKQGFQGATNFREKAALGHLMSPNQVNVSMANFNLASRSDAAGIQMSADRPLQTANPTVSEVGGLRSPATRDTGKAPAITSMPFKEHHLKQLRAQCLVFLAFRNGLAPKRLHLEIALGNILTQEGTIGSVDGAQNELTSDRGKQPTTIESSCSAEATLAQVNPAQIKNERVAIGTAAAGCGPDVDAVLNETKSIQAAGVKMGILENASHIDAQKHNPLGRGTFEAETQSQEVSNSSVLLTAGLPLDRSNMISPAVHSREDSLQPGGTNHGDYVLATNNPLKPEMARWAGAAQNDFSHGAVPASVPYELGSSKDSLTHVSQHDSDILHAQRAGIHLSTPWNAIRVTEDDNGALDKTMSVTDGSKVAAGFDSSYICRSSSPHGSEPEDEDKSVSAGMAPSPKQTLSEKWIMACQKRKVVNEQKWAHKLQKADQRIAYRFSELKETVSSSEDISAKTRSVIELKKLQLLELQRRLRSNIMNDFFKPVQSEMDQLKSIKKHRIGRRMKHVEKYEQKMKEERQKRIRERQKEFFSEIEVHRERLEDVFKFKRERCKGFNRYVKEFHKRKERIHREKIDRIQREKINLLKINDVEGYLRMVQDAKSDRVKQLLKETEKYLQKLGSKLQEAKTSAREVDIDENHIATFDASSENAAETEDETDQAKHYKESNEKYYLIAHSIKESITEQPAGIQGGKLREYQMNGLRWLVSLYNNHLNGILADEMGLGKTVQVISLLCYLMEAKNDRGPFLVVVPSSVLPGWEREMSFWAPGINKIIYAGPPEERRRLFKDSIVHQKFNVLLTTYEYLMNKHDRPKLSKIHWHYVIIDEGHRIKNASCKLNADLKHYHSSHRLLLTGTPLQNSLEELWALLNFLLPNIFNSSEDFSQWFNKPFEGNGDNSPDEALLSEEENLLIINRLHQVLRPFVLRRLKHKVENELPEKIERLVRCEASAYQKLLMMRVEENLGSLGMTKGRAIHNTVMELRNICNHPYLSHLHVEEVDSLIPKHFLPPIIRLCGKLEMLDRLLPKLKETNHRVLFFSTMTRLLDIMEDYLVWKQYRYLRLDGHTSGQDRGALIEKFNQPDSPFFIFLLSIRAGGVGVNLQAADTVIIFDTDWNPQVDLQAQARAHRIGQKKDVLVLRLETVKSVEEQVRAAAEHKLGVANQSITAGFFDNNTSAEDRREYLESLLRESKKEEAAPVLDDDSLNDILARSESEIEVFEAIDQKRREEEMATWKTLVMEHGGDKSEALPPFPSRLVTDDDLKAFYEAMKIHEAPTGDASSSSGVKRKGGYVGGFDSQHYGRGKRAREVRSYEEQWSEEEFEKLCQSEYPETIKLKDEEANVPQPSESGQKAIKVEIPLQSPQPAPPSFEPSLVVKKEVTPPVKRGRGRPRRTPSAVPPVGVSFTRNTIAMCEPESQPQKEITSTVTDQSRLDSSGNSAVTKDTSGGIRLGDAISPKRQGRKGQTCQNNISGEPGTETIRRRGRKPSSALPPVPTGSPVQDLRNGEQLKQPSSDTCVSVNASPKVTSDNTSADDSRGSLPKCSEGSDILSSKDTKPYELAADNNSFDASLEAAASPTHKETAKHEALSHSQNTPVQQHMVMLGGTSVENPILNEKPVKNVISDSSAVNSAPREPQASAGSTVLSVGGGIPLLKADLPKDSPQPAASRSEVQPSSTTPRTSRRQSVKPQNAAEPARRRGRKRGPSVAADSTLPFVQDQNLHEPLKITSTMVTHVAPPTNMGAVTVPVTPLISVSGPQTGSAAVTAVSGSVVHESVGFVSSDPSSLQPSPVLSGAANISSNTRRTSADLQTQGQAQRDKCTETAPRRRGRKKSTVSPVGLDQSVGPYTFSRQPDGKHGDLAEGKVISTRSRQVNISQPPSTQGDVHSATPFASLASRDSVAVPTPCIQQSPSIKAVGIGKPLDTRHTSTLEEMKQVVRPAEFPPISSKGRTNVIVLALDATSLDVDPIAVGDRNMHDNKEICNLQNRSTPGTSMLKPKFSRSEVIHATGQEVAKLDEELSAPPGFETSRLCKSDNVVTKSGENNGLGTADSPDTKMGTIVLGLKSAFQSSVPSFGCKNIMEKEEISKIHSLKNSGQETVVQTLPEDCSAIVDAATDKVMSCQPEEDMLAPPGFDIPQQRLTEKVAAKTLACDDYQASDMLTESGVSVRVEEDCREPISGDSGHDACYTPLAVCVMDSEKPNNKTQTIHFFPA
ncbi:chromatin structure-remodeling complex protein SYD-like [Silene latifolia]|uniref:chromatin structure-remodeling complex protein SYD-like n=1 Tax=Silene latifolia TaxID=37657 RepID=UPI003D7849C7